MNFVDKIGGLSGSGAWNQIATVDFIGRNTVDVSVKDKGEFLDALEGQGFYVTRNGEASQEVFSRRGTERAHPNDSAREIGQTFLNASLHLANDVSSRPNFFSTHFDPTSSIFKNQVFPDERVQGVPIPGSGWIREKIQGGTGHYNVDRSPAQIRQEIKQLGKSPSSEGGCRMRVSSIILLLGLLLTQRCSMKQEEPIQPKMPQSVRGWQDRIDKGVRSVAELVLKEGETSGNGRVEVRVEQIIPADLRAERNSYFGSPRVVLTFHKSTDKALLCSLTFRVAGGGLDQPGCDTKSMEFEAITVHAINTKEKWVWFSLFE